MKEFDYEKAKAGAPLCTRDGRPARIIFWEAKGTDSDGGQYPIVALVEEDGVEYPQTYTNDGRVYWNMNKLDDLMMAPVKREGWINIYKDEDGLPLSGGRIWKDKESAQDATQDNESYIATVKIEWEE